MTDLPNVPFCTDQDVLYDVAREATDDVMGEGAYARLNALHPDPGVQGAIARWEAAQRQGDPA